MTICFKSAAVRGGPAAWAKRFRQELQHRGYRLSGRLFPWHRYAYFNIDTSGMDWAQRFHTMVGYRIAGCYLPAWAEALGYGMRPEYVQTNEMIRRGLERADVVIYQSRWAKAQTDTTLFQRNDKYVIINNGVDLAQFSPRTIPPGSIPVIGTVGEFRHRFRLETFFQLSAALPFNHRLLIIGELTDSFSRTVMDTYERRLPTQAQLTYLPRVPPETLFQHYQKMDCFVHPVSGDWCPNVVAEALACGVPVVCPAFGGTAELVGDGGITVAHAPWTYDGPFIAKLASAVTRVLDDQQNFSRRARKQAETHCDLRYMVDQYLAAIGLPPRPDSPRK